MPQDVVQVAQIATRGGSATKMVDTVGTEDQATHEHVPQRVTVTPLSTQTAELVGILREVTGDGAFKVRGSRLFSSVAHLTLTHVFLPCGCLFWLFWQALVSLTEPPS